MAMSVRPETAPRDGHPQEQHRTGAAASHAGDSRFGCAQNGWTVVNIEGSANAAPAAAAPMARPAGFYTAELPS
jgi:hypothetical protein